MYVQNFISCISKQPCWGVSINPSRYRWYPSWRHPSHHILFPTHHCPIAPASLNHHCLIVTPVLQKMHYYLIAAPTLQIYFCLIAAAPVILTPVLLDCHWLARKSAVCSDFWAEHDEFFFESKQEADDQ